MKPTGKLTSKQLEDMRKRDHQMVKGVFRNMESKGGSVTFSFRKWKEDQVENYTLQDGQVYTLPIMVAEHLRDQCYVQQHTHILDMDGKPMIGRGRKHKRFTFEALSFDSDDKTSQEA